MKRRFACCIRLTVFAASSVAVAGGCAPAAADGVASPNDVSAADVGAVLPGAQPPGTSSAQVSSSEAAEKRAARPSLSPAAMQAYQAGEQAFRAGDLKGASAQFERTVQLDARAYQAHYSLGVVRERLGQPAAAQGSYRSALSIVTDYEPAILALASILMRSEKLGEAESFLSSERARLPDSAAVLTGLAEVKSLRKDSAAAQAFAQEALKKDPGFRPAMVALARDHYRNRRLDLSLYALAAILDGYGPENPPRDKNNAEARLLRALIYKEQGRRPEAIEEFRRAIELRPDLVEARINLATFYLESGNAPEAATVLEQALAYDASNVLVHLNLGDAYRLLGRPDEAIKQLQWVAQVDRNMPEPHYNLGLVYMFSKGIPGVTPEQAVDNAIAEFELFKKLRPRSRAGAGDDVDELLKRAQNKKAVAAALAAGGSDDEFK